jgi:glycosyltransferase involved in cell wall biosynthesis
MDAAEVRISKPDLLRVDVAMITYNQEAYIAQAIESVLAQKTTFPVRMVIGEDCSTDNTRAIIQQYAQRYPERFLLLLPDTNQGVMKNLRQVLEACDAPYVAILEGDDYWCDENKLQKQVDLIDKSDEYDMIFHDALFLYESHEDNIMNGGYNSFKEKFHAFFEKRKQVFSQRDIINNGWFMPTASMLIRNSILVLPYWFDVSRSGDYIIQLISTKRKNCLYIDEVMSVYRVHSQGISRLVESDSLLDKFIYETKKMKELVSDGNVDKFNIIVQNLFFKKSINNKNSIKRYIFYFKAITSSVSVFRKNFSRILKKNITKK